MRITPRWLACGIFAGLWLLGPNVARAHGLGTDEMADAANALLKELPPELRAKASLPLSSPLRKDWSFSPQNRTGIALDELSEAQRAALDDLLKNGLSQTGYESAAALMGLGTARLTAPVAAGPGNRAKYHVAIFGKPSEDAPWGWRVEGPDLSLNFTIADADNVAVTPAFFGASGAAAGRGNQRVFANEESVGLALATSLTDEQRKAAVIPGDVPGRMLTGVKTRADPLTPAGLTYARMTPAQRQQLTALVTLHARHFRLELGDESLLKIIAAGWDTVSFAWAGGLQPGVAQYYRIQGPTFVIEFAVSRGIDRAVQSVFREFDSDFGRDLLGER